MRLPYFLPVLSALCLPLRKQVRHASQSPEDKLGRLDDRQYLAHRERQQQTRSVAPCYHPKQTILMFPVQRKQAERGDGTAEQYVCSTLRSEKRE